ncbi:MAG TPA: hypothetical protein VKM55_29635 [Candidatus Lokiarchaeia archaeon]|nr:hypothetical protein [Candidatus Lokiarchaeia archaeon]
MAIPNHDTLNLDFLVLDMNGTIAVDGKMDITLKQRFAMLKPSLEIFMVS